MDLVLKKANMGDNKFGQSNMFTCLSFELENSSYTRFYKNKINCRRA
jgi:hypothetical protein